MPCGGVVGVALESQPDRVLESAGQEPPAILANNVSINIVNNELNMHVDRIKP